jgi:hypothetical protein
VGSIPVPVVEEVRLAEKVRRGLAAEGTWSTSCTTGPRGRFYAGVNTYVVDIICRD